MTTIRDVEGQVQVGIGSLLKELQLLPEGYGCAVRLHSERKKKKQTAAFQNNWHPDTDFIEITFERAKVPKTLLVEANPKPVALTAAPSPLTDLIRALGRAESRPGYKFVSLKWFRDTALLAEGFPWASSDSVRKSVLGDAIDKRLILTSSVHNPNSPYATTAVRLNRLMPEVQRTLGIENIERPDFAPLQIRGDNLSATVLHDRR